MKKRHGWDIFAPIIAYSILVLGIALSFALFVFIILLLLEGIKAVWLTL